MKKRVHYRTGEGLPISATDHPSYATRRRAARKAKEGGHSTLYEYNTAENRRYNISHFIH